MQDRSRILRKSLQMKEKGFNTEMSFIRLGRSR